MFRDCKTFCVYELKEGNQKGSKEIEEPVINGCVE